MGEIPVERQVRHPIDGFKIKYLIKAICKSTEYNLIFSSLW